MTSAVTTFRSRIIPLRIPNWYNSCSSSFMIPRSTIRWLSHSSWFKTFWVFWNLLASCPVRNTTCRNGWLPWLSPWVPVLPSHSWICCSVGTSSFFSSFLVKPSFFWCFHSNSFCTEINLSVTSCRFAVISCSLTPVLQLRCNSVEQKDCLKMFPLIF